MIDSSGSDRELLSAWATGSRAAGAELFERYFAVLHRFFRNKVRSDVEDLVQQTFLSCLEARDRYRGGSSFKTYLLAIARNQLFKHYRRLRGSTDFTLSSICDRGTSPSGQLAKRQGERLVTEALRRVSLDAQVILELAYWEGLAAPDIAEVLDLKLNSVYSRLHRAKQSLREHLLELAPDPPSLSCALRAVEAIAVDDALEPRPEHPARPN